MVGAVVGSVSFCVGSPAVSDGLVSAGVFTPPVGFVSSGETAGFSTLPIRSTLLTYIRDTEQRYIMKPW